MEQDTYQTISNTEATGLYKEKGSKFLSFAYPIENETIAKEKVNQLKKKYYDASHHCFAYIIGENQEIYRVNDDGEPSHSAGSPIWGAIRSHQLTNTLVVVVRYYGGINLGASGLANAYKTAANLALEQAEKIEKVITKTFYLTFDYAQMNAIMTLIKTFEGKIITQNAAINCSIEVNIRKKLVESFEEKIKNLIL
ncbi:MAG: YigZ family protein [Cytophagales bacterium]|nr:MAG: YigZ family protein [Cytophagales bacterium]